MMPSREDNGLVWETTPRLCAGAGFPAAQSCRVRSADGAYRYALSTRWNAARSMRLLFILYNPSSGPWERAFGPVARKLYVIADQEGYGGFSVVNVYGFMASNPRDLIRVDPVGSDNDRFLREWIAGHERSALTRDGLIVCGWGRGIPSFVRRAEIISMIGDRDVFCLGTNADGSPRHPSHMAYRDLRIRPWTPSERAAWAGL